MTTSFCEATHVECQVRDVVGALTPTPRRAPSPTRAIAQETRTWHHHRGWVATRARELLLDTDARLRVASSCF